MYLNKIVKAPLLSCLLFAGVVCAQDAPPEGFQALFNGTDLEGWFGRKTEDPRKLWDLSSDEIAALHASTLEQVKEHWKVVDGVLENDGSGLYLTSKQYFGDFELLVEYKTVAKGDSGIYLRGVPQVQIWDSTETSKFELGADKGSGGLWNNTAGSPGRDPLKLMDRPFGEWNRFRILMIGERVSVWLNGGKVVDHAVMENFFEKKQPVELRAPMPNAGPIQLQTHGAPISWRNIYVRQISGDEANVYLSEKSGDDFEELFDGKTLRGWTGATEEYEVVDGAIQCAKGAGGNLLHETEFADFHLRFEFKLPPGGNNGIALRVPDAKGNPSVEGLEVQILDEFHERYDDLKPSQYHGSVYTLVPSRSGYLRPTGEWNHQEIIYKGSHIQVIVNGTSVVDRDLSELEIEHKGKERTSGFIGFAGHDDPVAFRRIAIKELHQDEVPVSP